ncbi:hypothetical protein IQ265_04355 [Nodosilinea sp. LEGE 06152]|uniref:hypothetical protein n=1 Tax=Nodosilinea sp. LEGE 06152 TaxID=2777966 RepID=UPI001881FB23|nr:hypothetical protein [Nodosilinea sp. LEGE 06152]MBE9156067.1 hypothetical protein [Nodosilinea sp. LEGE 06152]
MNEMASNPMPSSEDVLQPEYRFDYPKAKPNRFAVGNDVKKLKVVVLDDDVAQVFTTPEAVNKALRAFIEAMPQPQT